MKTKEIFKDIPGYEGIYQISNLGSVKSLERWRKNSGSGYIKKESILKEIVGSVGYFKYTLCKEQKRKYFNAHQLVAMAFLNHKPNGFNDLVVDHINNNKLDNRVVNLHLITQRENANKKHIKSKTKYIGVTVSKYNKFISRIVINGFRKYLGTFKTEYEAHLAYQKELKKIKQNGTRKKNCSFYK